MSYKTFLGATAPISYDSSGINPAKGSNDIIAPAPTSPITPDDVPPAEYVKPSGEEYTPSEGGSEVIINPESGDDSNTGGSSLSQYLPYLAIGILLFLTMKGKKR